MEEREIPVNPHNFTVWYLYCSDSLPNLTRTLDILIDNDEQFTEERNAEIYDQFFSQEDENAALSDAAAKIESMLGDILAYLGQAGDGAAQYGKSLEVFTGEIDESKSADDLKTIISGVLSETRTVMKVNKALEKRLDDSSKHVSELKENMEDLSEVVFDHDYDSLINALDVARLHPPVLAASDDLQAALAVMCDKTGKSTSPSSRTPGP